MNFSSENFDRVHPRIMQALIQANEGFAPSYGKDEYTENITGTLKTIFNHDDLAVFFCFNGTGANNFALGTLTEKYHSIFCPDVSHLYMAESTAPEAFTGCRLYPIHTVNGKIEVQELSIKIKKRDNLHLPVPGALTITQPTEYGTVYSLKELREIGDCCRENNIRLHIDGARICNALAALDCSFSDLITACNADVLTLGGTKMGLLAGEAVVFFNSKRFSAALYYHKRSMQLASKSRFLAVQFMELFRDDLWKELAHYTNGLAKYFEEEIRRIDPAIITYPVETNVAFIKMNVLLYEKLKAVANFYMWDGEKEETRFMFSFSNTREEIDSFVALFKSGL